MLPDYGGETDSAGPGGRRSGSLRRHGRSRRRCASHGQECGGAYCEGGIGTDLSSFGCCWLIVQQLEYCTGARAKSRLGIDKLENSHEYFRAEKRDGAGNRADRRDARSDRFWRGLVARRQIQARATESAGLDPVSIRPCEYHSNRHACVWEKGRQRVSALKARDNDNDLS